MQSTIRFGTSRFGTWCALTLTAAGLLVMPAAQAQQTISLRAIGDNAQPDDDTDNHSRQKARRRRRRRQKK